MISGSYRARVCRERSVPCDGVHWYLPDRVVCAGFRSIDLVSGLAHVINVQSDFTQAWMGWNSHDDNVSVVDACIICRSDQAHAAWRPVQGGRPEASQGGRSGAPSAPWTARAA